MPPSAASILRASSLALLLLAATATVTATDGDGGTSTASGGNSSVAATATDGDGGITTASGGNSSVARQSKNTEMYLCTGRNPMLIRYCPIYWDKGHLECEEPDVAAGPAASLRPAAAATSPRETHDGQACYVMKLYRNGSYVIVSWHDCEGMDSCRLTCGGGEAADGKALGAAPRPVTATAPQGMLPPPYRIASSSGAAIRPWVCLRPPSPAACSS